MPIKLFDYTIQLTFFFHKPTYSCYKPQIPKLRTIDSYKTYELLILNPTDYQSFLKQTADFKLQTTNPF